MPPHVSDKFQFIGSRTGFLYIRCRKCETDSVAVEYLGQDPVTPKIKTTCRSCDESTVWTIMAFPASGFPTEPSS